MASKPSVTSTGYVQVTRNAFNRRQIFLGAPLSDDDGARHADRAKVFVLGDRRTNDMG